MEIGFNGTYLVDAVNAVSGKMVKMSLVDANSSAVIVDDDDASDRFIVMPMRL